MYAANNPGGGGSRRIVCSVGNHHMSLNLHHKAPVQPCMVWPFLVMLRLIMLLSNMPLALARALGKVQLQKGHMTCRKSCGQL